MLCTFPIKTPVTDINECDEQTCLRNQPRFFNVHYSICEPRVMPNDRTRSLRQDYFIVMCEGSKAPGSSKQARLDDRLTAVLLYSPRAPFMKCKPHKGQDVLSGLRIILLERWCDLTLGVVKKNSNRSSLLLFKEELWVCESARVSLCPCRWLRQMWNWCSMGLWDSIQRERVQVLDVSLVNTNTNKDPYELHMVGK